MVSVEHQSHSTQKMGRRKKIPSQYLDQQKFELKIPEFPKEGVKEIIRCGFMKWTFSFNNKQIDHEYIMKKLKSRQKVRKKYAKGKDKKRASKWRKARQGFLLSAECEPDSVNMQPNPNLSFPRWRVNAMIVPNWKESQNDGSSCLERKRRRIKEIDRGWLFTNKVIWHGIKHYPPLACRRQENVLSIKLRVLRIRSFGPTAFVPNDEETLSKICLNAGDEHIYVERALLEFHSPILLEHIKDGIGTSKRNAINLESRFKPSLVKLAIRVVGFHSEFYVLNIPELLDFATTYGFHTLLRLVERKLVTKRCQKLCTAKKLNLAYQHRLYGFIYALSKKINKPTVIKRHLRMKDLPTKFKELLKRRMTEIETQVSGIEAKSKERRERKRQRREKKMKCDGLNKGVKKLKISA
ncbi:hypothetical protein GPALN_003753 [Globodera pallida]|nr:hypothetical protein GPALN_003753 [Globodera pallida]